MITRKTAFILGAGASFPFGFPLGQRLCEEVIVGFAENAEWRRLLLDNTAFSGAQIEGFCRELLFSGQGSVDAFLEIRSEFLEIGKAAMAVALVRREDGEKLWGFQDGNWLRYVLGLMRTVTLDEFCSNQIAFVTFNYDRSLEHFLFTSLKKTYRETDERCADAIGNRIPIIHLHGKLGDLPWQSRVGRAYDQEVSPQVIEMCARGIKVVHEDIRDGRDKEFKRAKELISDAERVYFLGFGYGETNIERLGIKDWPGGKQGRGTAKGLKTRERQRASRLMGDKVYLDDMDCLEFLRDAAELD